MQDVALMDGPVRVAGVLDMRRGPTGYRLRRLPEWTDTRMPDPMTNVVVAMPSGCRIEFVTTSSTIELDVMLTRIATGAAGAVPAVFDLVIDGEVTATASLTEGTLIVLDPADPTKVDIQAGEPSRVTFPGLGTANKRVEVWLPQAALVELRGLRLDDGAAVSAYADTRPRWAHYGSSISHCMEAGRPTGVWPVVAARLAGVNLQSFGLGGSCHLDQFVARTIRDLPADLLSMKVGINVVNGDTLRERAFGPALHGFLDTVRDGHPDIPILVVSPIFCPEGENHPGPMFAGPDGKFVCVRRPLDAWRGSLTLTRIRTILSEAVAVRADPNLHYLDGLSLFGPADAGDLPDDLHPNAAGYARMGARFHTLAWGAGGAFAAG